MSFKRTEDASKIDEILRNRTKSTGTVIQTAVQPERKKKVRERTRQYTFTMRPSVREKLTKLVDYDADFSADSAAGYLSELIENRFDEVFPSGD